MSDKKEATKDLSEKPPGSNVTNKAKSIITNGIVIDAHKEALRFTPSHSSSQLKVPSFLSKHTPKNSKKLVCHNNLPCAKKTDIN